MRLSGGASSRPAFGSGLVKRSTILGSRKSTWTDLGDNPPPLGVEPAYVAATRLQFPWSIIPTVTTPATSSLEAAYQSLDPQEVLGPGAAAYAARPVAPLTTLATQLRLGRLGGLHLVSGHIGSGKTTELRRLASEVTSVARVVFLALDATSPNGRLTAVEVANSVLQALRAPEPTKSFTSRLSAAVATGIIGAVSVPGRIRTDKEIEQQILAILKQELLDYESRFHTGTIVLLDGLDKLSLVELEPTIGRILNWKLPFCLVTTVPLSYLFTPSFSRREGEFAGVHVVPALPVVRSNLEPNPLVLDWFENVLVSRNVRDTFDRDAIDSIAVMTAGIIRDFVRSCREAVLAALVEGRSRVDLNMATVALSEFALRMSRPVSGDDLRVLKIVADTGRVVGHSTFLALIDGGQIVEYRNGSNWYAVHPLLRDIVAQFARELAS